MMWHPYDATDTCKSDAMWNPFSPNQTKSTHHRLSPFLPSFIHSFPLPSSNRTSRGFSDHSRRMDHSLRRQLVPPSSFSDPEPLLPRACGTELTRFTSDSSSAITVDNTASKDSSHHFSAAAGAAPFPDQLTRWTDQQHSLYLNSLEASFVKELHRSMRLRGLGLQNNADEAYKSRTLQNPHNMTRQSLALHDGCWKKISLERISPMLESTADSRVLVGSQFGLTSVERSGSLREPNTSDHELGFHAGRSSTFSDRTKRSLEKQCICCSSHPESVASTTEVTDQNFKNEVDGSSCMPLAKRLKTAEAEASSNDQVVPFGKFQTTGASSCPDSTSENKGQELLSELPERFHFPKSDLHYFLRGS